MPYQRPRGTNDITPAPRPNEPAFEVHKWQHAERTFQGLVEKHGYQEIRTPMFEDIELFIRSSGETSDIVTKEMYDFYDKGERHIALKPEGTAPVMRSYLENKFAAPGLPTRLWYLTHSFRYGRPGKGRYRQLHQLGLELIGSSSPRADAEIITLAYRFFSTMGMTGQKVLLNSIGKPADRILFGAVILQHTADYFESRDPAERAKAEANPLRLLDTKDPDLRTALQGLPSILQHLSDESLAHFEAVKSALDEEVIPYEVSDDVVRGLDYYTDTVFEVVNESLGENLSLAGGGRYDHLIGQIGGPSTPSVGVGIGVERLLLTLESLGIGQPVPPLDAFLIAATEDAKAPVRQLASSLRDQGFKVLIDLDDKKLGAQFKSADRSGARVALVLGDDELAAGTISVKVLATGDQTSIPQADLAAYLAG